MGARIIMSDPSRTIDFFISYRGQRRDWARWVNWVVRSAGFSTVLMEEFPGGTTWTDQMRDAAQRCRRLIPLYCTSYWDSGPCTAEFDAYWQQHLGDKSERFILPVQVEECNVPVIHQPLLFHALNLLDRDAARAKILEMLKGIQALATLVAYTENEPPFPPSVITKAALEWPNAAPALDWRVADHAEAQAAFQQLITRDSPFRLLALRGESETGKSHLTKQFLKQLRRKLPDYPFGRFDFKGANDLESGLGGFVQHLGISTPPDHGTLASRLNAILRELTKAARPTLLIFDTYELAGESDRWVRENLLTSLFHHKWLRVVIAGQKIPDIAGELWDDETRVVKLTPPGVDDWLAYGQRYPRSNGMPLTREFVEALHDRSGGKAPLLAQLLGPVT